MVWILYVKGDSTQSFFHDARILRLLLSLTFTTVITTYFAYEKGKYQSLKPALQIKNNDYQDKITGQLEVSAIPDQGEPLPNF